MRPAVVGAFVLGGLALAAASIILFGGSRLFAEKSRAVIFFEGSVAGLEVGAPVTFRGVRLGSVIRIALNFSTATRTARIPVTIEIDPDRVTWQGARPVGGDYSRLIAGGLRAQLASQSFVTGQLRVDLDFRPETPIRTMKGVTDLPEIPAIPSELDQLRSKLTELPLRDLVDTAQNALGSVDRLAARLDGLVDPLATSVRQTAETATRTLDTTGGGRAPVASGRRRDVCAERGRVYGGCKAAIRRARWRVGPLTDADRSLKQIDALVASVNSLTGPRANFHGVPGESAMRNLRRPAHCGTSRGAWSGIRVRC